MHWFGGSIAEAVNLSKQKNAIFVVFVEGENDLSTEMATTLDEATIARRLSDEGNFLAIKLKSGSPTYTHFAQIYQFVPVPSLFFIGRNGTPLEVICAGVHPDNLATRIDRIVEEHHKGKPVPSQPSTSADDVKSQTSSLLEAESAASKVDDRKSPHRDEVPESSPGPASKVPKTERTASVEEYEVVCEGDICVRRIKAQVDPGPSQNVDSPAEVDVKCPSPEESAASVEEKMQKAKELIEARRREKAEKEKELERQKELERRSAGQGVAELKKWQSDQEMKQLQEERKREKMENNLARQRVLEQIAQDRAERRARESPAAPAHPPAPSPAPSPSPATPAPSPAAYPNTSGDASGRARIQFKLPDGSSHSALFDAETTLAAVQAYCTDQLNLPTANYALWTAFPRQELSDSSSTLRQLHLAPSAALLVLPRSNRAVSESRPGLNLAFFTTFLSQLFTSLIYEPGAQLWAWLRVRMFGAGGGGGASPSAPGPSAPPRDAPPRGPASTLRYRPRTNIHRLNGDRSSDDENNTWNGNSTQQM